MSPLLITSRSIARIMLLAIIVSTLSVYGQDARLQLGHLDRLAAIATESVEITLDELRMRAVTKLLTLSARDQTKLRELLTRLTGVYIRGFEFANEGEYTEADVDLIRAQLKVPGWHRIVEVRERSGEKTEVYLMPHNNALAGFTTISTEPRKLCVMNIVGQINLDEMNLLEKHFELNRCDIGSRRQRRNR